MELDPPLKHIFSALSSTLPEPSWAAITIGKGLHGDGTCTVRSDNPPVPYKGVRDEAGKPLRVGSKGAEQARAELIGKVIAEQVVQYSLV